MFADLIATEGLFGMLTIFIYFYISYILLLNYINLNNSNRFIALSWTYLVFIGIGSDHTHIDALFFVILGLAISASRINLLKSVVKNENKKLINNN